MVDSSSQSLEKEWLQSNLASLQIARNTQPLNHSQFDDDTLLLGGASKVIAWRFKYLLE